jgi:T5SS/PEP-CTERM-associated repeat protein
MKPRLHLLFTLVFLTGCGNLSAQFIWTGSSVTSGSVLDGTNWQSGTPVGTAGTETLQFGDVVGAQTGIVFPGTTAFQDLTFVTGTSRPFYTVSGTGTSPVLILDGNITVQTGAGVNFDPSLVLSLAAGGHTVDVAGPTVVQFNGLIGGSGSLIATGTGTVQLGGNNNYTGGTTVDLGGTLAVLGASARINHSGADLTVGANGASTSTLAISAGGQVSVNNGWIGTGAGTASGLVTLDGAGSSLTSVNFLYLGDTGNGSLSVTNGATVTSSFFTLGNNAGATGHLHLDGPGTQLNSSLNIFVGEAGQGDMTITNGAKVTGYYSDIGDASTGSGTLTVDGAGSQWNQTNTTVGVAGTGVLNITNGAVATTTAYANIGQSLGSNGTVTVDGVGSQWNNASFMRIGDGGNGTVHISNHGTVSGGEITIGDSSGGTGTVTVDGAGSSLTTDNNLYVGYDGTGVLIIGNGGSASALLNGIVGEANAGSASVDGAGSSWNNAASLYIGDAAMGNLSITNGGSSTNTNTYVGNNAGGIGGLTISGAGSVLNNSGQFYIGLLGTGVASIINGGHAIDNVGSIGNNAGSGSGTVTVDGVGSVWDNTTNLHVGDSTTGILNITGGGVVNSQDGYLATFSTGFGSVDIDGAGSAWNVIGALYVGYVGNGVFLLNNHGAVNVGGGNGTIYLGYSSGATGQLTIGSGGGPGGVVDAAAITTLTGTGTVTFSTGTDSSSPYYLTKDGTSGGTPVVISGPTVVTQFSGYNVLNGNNTYTGGTVLAGGTLVAGSNNALGTGAVTFTGTPSVLNVASGVTLSNPLSLPFGGTLAGNGTFATAITAGAGVILAPGNSPGTLTFANGLTLAGGGALNFQVQLAGGTAGSGYDLVIVSGGVLNLTANSSLPFTLNLQSLDGTGAPGNVSDFNSSLAYSWMIFNAPGGITGFSPSDFVIDTSGFTNNPAISGFFVTQSGNSIVLDFAPVPEPSTYALLFAGLGLVGVALRRRRAARG